jgi:penicillin-binding protein 1A
VRQLDTRRWDLDLIAQASAVPWLDRRLMNRILTRVGYGVAVVVGLVVVVGQAILFAVILIFPSLPSLDRLTNYQPQLPLRVFTADGVLIGEFGEERRTTVKIDTVPQKLRQAILAAEDERFYQHGGIDYAGVLRAAWADIVGGGEVQGASTITMQVARNFFLGREKTFKRKFYEALLALKIEGTLSKGQILELYVNQIYLGERAYGFAAAAEVYFGKPLDKLSLAEMAVLAALPKSPAHDNPVVSPERASERRGYVLRRMHELGYISDVDYQAARQEPLKVRGNRHSFAVEADYVAEMARQAIFERYQEEGYSEGLNVYTTIRADEQLAADAAVRQGVLDYDHRHGYRGPEGFVELPSDQAALDDALREALDDAHEVNGLKPGVVLEASPTAVKVYLKGGERIDVRGDGLKFARQALSAKAAPKQRLLRGSLIRVERDAEGLWKISQLPEVEAALVSIDPRDGAIHALVGGFDFDRNKFNHVTQALRQPGSSFKPFIYSAALEKGFSPGTIVADTPVTFESESTGWKPWTPGNYEHDFLGAISMRTALVKSRNVASARILQSIGIPYARDYATRFGFSADQVPPYLTMVLGVGSVTPLQMAQAYSIFANTGYRVTPYFIERIVDRRGGIVQEAKPTRAGEDERVIDVRNAFIMTSIMQDVIRRGTAARAMQLGRRDLAGKTGTTSDFTDAWFDGFNQQLVAVVWIGFDQPRSLGKGEVGARAALPIWMNYIGTVLKGKPETPLSIPDGVVRAPISSASGQMLESGQTGQGGMADYVYQEDVPSPPTPDQSVKPDSAEKAAERVKSQLF